MKSKEANGQARKAPRVWGADEAQAEGCLPSQAIGRLTNHELDVAASVGAKAGCSDVMQDQELPATPDFGISPRRPH